MPGGTLIPGPYEELAPDGRRYFKILGVSQHLLRMYVLLLDASDIALLRRTPAGKAQALEIDRLILRIKEEVDTSAALTAVEATKIIRNRIEATRVRPPTAGVKPSNTSLVDAIESRRVPSALPGGGAVGVGDIEALDVGTNNPSRRAAVTGGRTSYWRAQEYGSDHLVGHTLYGVFQPGEAAPSPNQSRTHPVFEARGRGEGKRKQLTVRKPIEERAFLREGAYEAFQFRRGLHKRTEAKAIARMQAIAGLGGL